jgi:hypothetical protein
MMNLHRRSSHRRASSSRGGRGHGGGCGTTTRGRHSSSDVLTHRRFVRSSRGCVDVDDCMTALLLLCVRFCVCVNSENCVKSHAFSLRLMHRSTKSSIDDFTDRVSWVMRENDRSGRMGRFHENHSMKGWMMRNTNVSINQLVNQSTGDRVADVCVPTIDRCETGCRRDARVGGTHPRRTDRRG